MKNSCHKYSVLYFLILLFPIIAILYVIFDLSWRTMLSIEYVSIMLSTLYLVSRINSFCKFCKIIIASTLLYEI